MSEAPGWLETILLSLVAGGGGHFLYAFVAQLVKSKESQERARDEEIADISKLIDEVVSDLSQYLSKSAEALDSQDIVLSARIQSVIHDLNWRIRDVFEDDLLLQDNCNRRWSTLYNSALGSDYFKMADRPAEPGRLAEAMKASRDLRRAVKRSQRSMKRRFLSGR